MRRTLNRLKRRKEPTVAFPSGWANRLGGVGTHPARLGHYRRLWQADDEDQDVAAR